ncbi:ribonuclease R [Desulfonatronovibrio magnus]|uniref:ribonuclease R n=1 Tax=Desulfonatronovibrio magnus TaxID=698827 RepID=UPI0005EB56AA|nr:ribonuclease R [Desulfonatronovibrio magnus]
MSKLSKKKVLGYFKETNKPLSLREIMSGLRLGRQDKQKVKDILKLLSADGRIFKARKTWCLVEELPMQKAILEIQRSGVGFAIPFDKRRKDIFVHPKNFNGAWHGDTVLVATLPGKRGKSPDGRVASIIERAVKMLPVKVVKSMGPNLYLTRPANPRLDFSMLVMSKDQDLSINTMVVAEPQEQMESGLWSGNIIRIMGHEHSLEVQEEIVKLNHKVPVEFPLTAVKEAEKLPQSPDHIDFQGRKDLRNKIFVTIDGAQAKDFDDAICIEAQQNGHKLYVAIADVSHYVPVGSKLDKEALVRGNSYYFPLSVEPMFPEKLSNGLCSLNPDVPRLVMVAQMTFNDRGKRTSSSFYPAVIQSAARLTYSQVNEALYLDQQDPDMDLQRVLPMLKDCDALARRLLELRQSRGSIDFDLPEPEVLRNLLDGSFEIKARTRNFAHQIIEEFMLAANEAVAEFLEKKEALFLYRVHPAANKDKLDSLFKLLANTDLGPKLPKERDPRSLQQLIEISREYDLEFLVSRLVLRSMMQARYATENEGHFGLASDAYCHFTSPIRRYADLVVHRALKNALGMDIKVKAGLKSMKKVADSLSSLERVAMNAEREILKRATILFLMDKIGQTYDGVVSSITDFGFWVELEDVLAEGMVRLSNIHDDYYHFRPEKQDLLGKRTGKRFYLGLKVRVNLRDVNLNRLEVDFDLA